LNVLVCECSSLEEFGKITGMPYHVGAVYSEGTIYTQPFRILRSKGCLEDTLLHELLHHVLQLNFELPRWMEEGLVLTLLGVRPEQVTGFHRESLLRFLREVDYEEIPSLLDRHRIFRVERGGSFEF